MNATALGGIISIILGIAYGAQALALPRATIGDPMAPIYFPMGLSVLLIILGAMLVLQEMKKGKIFDINKIKGTKLSYTGKLIAYVCAVSVLYALLFERIGFVFSTFLFMEAILLAINGKKQWVTNTIVSACFSIGIYIVFAKLFGISLPITPFIYI